MRSRKNVVLWVMLLCVAFATAGCRKDAGEESALVSVDETEIPADMEDGSGEGAKDGAGDSTKEDGDLREAAGEDPKALDGVADTGFIYVDVCGQVKSPGVYKIAADSRVYEAIEEAGGMTKKAAAAAVNQAERLSDGQQIYVPAKDETAAGSTDGDGQTVSGNNGAGGIASGAGSGKVNLNTASKQELMTLTGIGEVKADAMIRYREEHGGFQSVEDVKKIEGIKDGVFNKIKDQITV